MTTVRLRQIRWSKSPDGPWSEPCVQDGEKLTSAPASDWSKAERHSVFRGMYQQERVVEYVPKPINDAELKVICAASILVRDGEERPEIRKRLATEVREALAELSKAENS